MSQLEAKGSESCRRIYRNHGAPEPLFGVKVADLKTILKSAGGDHALALKLWDTGNSDAMYLAGMMADAERMTRRDLERWASSATWHMLSEYAVAGVAAESPHGEALAAKWIDAKSELVADAGWTTWSGLVAVRPDEALDLKRLGALLGRVEKTIDGERNRVRYAMNQFVIGVGCYVEPLLERARQTAAKIGTVEVDLGGTACKVPLAADYIAKVAEMNRVGKKRRMVRC